MTSPRDVFLHIGTMKSGTSYLQAVLKRNKTALEQAGVFVPDRMVAAATDALGKPGRRRTMETRGEWPRVVSEIAAWQGDRVVASHEFLGAATHEQADAIAESLAPHRVTVIITARDLARVIPSHWQTVVKGAKTWLFAEYVGILLDEPGTQGAALRAHRGFWAHQDLARITSAWCDTVGAENVVVVTVPPSEAPPDLLWSRFAHVVGIDPAAYDHEPDSTSNVSLSYGETEMLRQVNVLLGDRLGPVEYRSLVNNFFANKVLRDAPRQAATRDRPALGPASHARVSALAAEMVGTLRCSRVRVVGDLSELEVAPFAGDPDVSESTPPQERVPDVVPYLISQLLIELALAQRKGGGSSDLPGEGRNAHRRDARAARLGR
ncbi:MAG: hypothetical protein QOI06_3041 [Nocardioidaceae bacterium]|jgi:hypothetical protein|nr:hypothetical protein [Nocardioidaceae bacterium]